MPKNKAFLILAICLCVFLGVLLTNQALAQDSGSSGIPPNEMKPPPSDRFPEPSKMDATGKEFVLKDGIFDLKLVSSEEVHIYLEAFPKRDEGKPTSTLDMISIHIEPITSTTKKETRITITGLEVFRTDGEPAPLYCYQEGYLKESFKVDSEGKCSFNQDISKSHHLWISEETSTLYIGTGEPSSYYDYDPKTRTYTFKKDYTGTIVVTDDNITIKGNGHTFRGRSSYGYYLYERTYVIISYVGIYNYTYGIYMYKSHWCKIYRNRIKDNTWGICLMRRCHYNEIYDHSPAYNGYIRSNTTGIYFGYKGYDNEVYRNEIYSNRNGIWYANRAGIEKNDIFENTIRDNNCGLYLSSRYFPRFWHNNIYDNYGWCGWNCCASTGEYTYLWNRHINQGNYWGHPEPGTPGFRRYHTSNPDCNHWHTWDKYPYKVEDGWKKGYKPGEIEDKTKPYGTIGINGEPPGPITTTNLFVTLHLSITDTAPAYGPWYMRFRNEGEAYTDGWKWASNTVPCDITYDNWPLSDEAGPVTKTVYAQFKSRVHVSSEVSDSIIYSVNQDPVCTVTSPVSGTYISETIDINVVVTDTDNNPVVVTAYIDEFEIGSITLTDTADGEPGTIPFNTTITNDGGYALTIECNDGQGGVTTLLSDITIDNTPPTVTGVAVMPPVAGLGGGVTVPANNVMIQVLFSETMDINFPPTVTYDPTGVIGPQLCTLNPAWFPTTFANDTYTVFNTNDITPATGDGSAIVIVTDAQDLAGNISVITTTTFLININPLVLQNQTAVPLRFNPSLDETTTVSYVLSEPAQTVEITAEDADNVAWIIYGNSGQAGLNSFTWDGMTGIHPVTGLTGTGNFPFQAPPYRITFNASNPWETAGQRTKNINISDIPVITDLSDVPPYPFQAGLDITTIQFSLSTLNPIDILMSIKEKEVIADVTVTDSDIKYDGQGDGAFGQEQWGGTDTPLFAGGGTLVNDAIYYYEIAQVSGPPPQRATNKTGTIVLLNNNTSVTSTPDGAVTVYYNPLTPGLGTINIQPVDPTTLTDEVKAIVTADPLVYIQSNIYDIFATPPVNFTLTPALVVFQYDPTITGDVTDRLLLRSYDSASVPPWVNVDPQRIDLVNHQIIAEVTSLSLFAIFSGADTTPPVITITSPAPMEYPNLTDGQPTVIPITYIAEDPVIDGVTSGISYTSVTLNGQVYTGATIDLSNLFGENILTVKAIDGSGNVAWKSVRFTVVLTAMVTLKPESLKVNPGVLTAFVRFPTGYDVMSIIDATCDKAQYESMELATDDVTRVFKFRRKAIEEALAEKGEVIDTEFEIRGTFSIDQQTYIFKGIDTIQKVLPGSVPPENK